MSFARRLKNRRIEMGLTQIELAEKLGVTKGAIGNYETEVSSMRAETLLKACEVLDCDPNYLFQDEMDELEKDSVRTLSEDARKLISYYDGVSVPSKEMIRNYAEALYYKENTAQQDNPNTSSYDQPQEEEIDPDIEHFRIMKRFEEIDKEYEEDRDLTGEVAAWGGKHGTIKMTKEGLAEFNRLMAEDEENND